MSGRCQKLDPALGVRTLTYIKSYRVWRITDLPAFIILKGGAYFFLPGLKALRYLATLNGR